MFKWMKKVLAITLAATMLLGTATTAMAGRGDIVSGFGDEEENEQTQFITYSDDLSSVLEQEGLLFNTESLPFENNREPQSEIVDVFLSKETVVIESNGFTDDVVLAGQISDSNYANLTALADWESRNEDVATSFSGKITARGKGETIIDVTYGAFKKEITVIVLEEIDLEAEAEAAYEASLEENGDRSPTAVDGDTAKQRALDMNAHSFKTTKVLYKYKNGTWASGSTIKGIEYTQSNSVIYQVLRVLYSTGGNKYV